MKKFIVVLLTLITLLLSQEEAKPYSKTQNYIKGDKVYHSGDVYRCKVGGWCSQVAYEPKVSLYYKNAWEDLGEGEPIGKEITKPTADVWKRDSNYKSGDSISYNSKIYTCKGWPYTPWCKTRAPGSNGWLQAWKLDKSKPKIVSLTLSSPKMELKHNSITTINLNAKQTNSKTLTITNNIEWIIEDNSIVEITDTTIKALKEGSSTIQAKVDNITSNKITLIVYKEINKHRLPPKPDPKLNNSTLLGIDTNNNGVRDDVERKIYFRYKKPVIQAYMMQSAKSYRKILDNPIVAATS